jgi:hypothetical protein
MVNDYMEFFKNVQHEWAWNFSRKCNVNGLKQLYKTPRKEVEALVPDRCVK